MPDKLKIFTTTRFEKRISKIKNRQVNKKIIKNAKKLAQNPKKGKLLKGQAGKAGVRSLRFSTQSGEMRLLYQIKESEEKILILTVGPREEIYSILKNWITR